MKYKEGDIVTCIKSWRGDGDYIWGGTAAFKQDETYKIGFVIEEEDGEFTLAIESGMGSPDIVHTDREPKFSEYFK